MTKLEPFWKVFYDSVIAIVGGAAAAIVYASFSESQFVTFGASVILLGMLIVLGYVILLQGISAGGE